MKSKIQAYCEHDSKMALDFMEAWYGKILSLRNEANELIENHVPQVYNDGDIRAIPIGVYDRVVILLETIRTLEGNSEDQGSVVPIFRGPFGVLHITRAEEER